jgi:Na+/H+-dicarboxylate symporter
MSLTNRILLAMAAGIALGSTLEWLLGVIDPAHGVHVFIQNGLVWGVFDVVGRIFIASLKLLVVPLVMVSLICGMSSLGSSSRMGSIAGRTIGLYLLTYLCRGLARAGRRAVDWPR